MSIPVHELLADVFRFHSAGNSLRDEVCHFLTGQYVPYSVTGEKNKVPVRLNDLVENVRVTSNNLFALRQFLVHFEDEVSQSSRQSQVPVDSVELHKPAGSLNPLSLLLILQHEE